jgi:hypothetical protein
MLQFKNTRAAINAMAHSQGTDLNLCGYNQPERAVVVTLTVKLVAAVPLNAIVAGTEQLAPVGAPLQLSEAVPLNPSPPIDNLYIALWPAETEADAEPPEGTPRPILTATPAP